MTLNVADSAKISNLAGIEPNINETEVTVGENSVIDSFVKIKPAGGRGHVTIGDRVTVNAGCVIYTGNGLTIGNDIAIAANCVFAPTNHEFGDAKCLIRDQGFRPSKGGIVIEDDVWIGAGCVFLDGAHVRRGAVIGALSLVRGEVPPLAIAVGNPLEVRGWRT